MSRIGKQPIAIPAKVKVDVKGSRVFVEGPKGKLDMEIPRRTAVKVEGANVSVSRQGDDAEARAMHGLSRALLNNLVKGVSEGYVKKLEINGVGFKAAVQGKIVNMSLGYSHPINYDIPDQIKVTVPDALRVGHEAHFAQVASSFLKYVRDRSALPAWERPNMLAKYYTTTAGAELSRQSPPKPADRIAPR